MITWDEARDIALASAGGPLPPVSKNLGEALGHALAEPLVALTDLPPFDSSAMDGWAVAGNGPWTVRDADVLADGSPLPLTVGTAADIVTGARVPAGTTGILRSEHGDLDAQGMLSEQGAGHIAPGKDIRPQGEECRRGDVLVPSGTAVTPAFLGLAAAIGHDQLVVHGRPTVEMLVLGDELLTAGPPRDGRVRDALGPMLPPMLRACGSVMTGHVMVADSFELLRKAIDGSEADVVITTGSTSVGPRDLLHDALEQVGAPLLVDSVGVRPGHPMLLADLAPTDDGRARHLVGLPGNPLAAVAGLVTLAIPMLRRLGGHTDVERRRMTAAAEMVGHARDTRLVPVTSDDGGVLPLPFRGPGMLRGLALADFLAVVPPGGVAAGNGVEVVEVPGW